MLPGSEGYVSEFRILYEHDSSTIIVGANGATLMRVDGSDTLFTECQRRANHGFGEENHQLHNIVLCVFPTSEKQVFDVFGSRSEIRSRRRNGSRWLPCPKLDNQPTRKDLVYGLGQASTSLVYLWQLRCICERIPLFGAEEGRSAIVEGEEPDIFQFGPNILQLYLLGIGFKQFRGKDGWGCFVYVQSPIKFGQAGEGWREHPCVHMYLDVLEVHPGPSRFFADGEWARGSEIKVDNKYEIKIDDKS